MDSLNEKWAVTYQYHNCNEVLFVKTDTIFAESIGEALTKVDNVLSRNMEIYGWSDYHITSVNIIPELH